MPRLKRFTYKLQVHFTGHTKRLLIAAAAARGKDRTELIREYVDHGLARDVVRYGIHLNNDGDTDE
jgi:hypothetical protein